MKHLTKVLGLSAGIVMLGALTSCSNDEPAMPGNAGNSPAAQTLLVHTPTVNAWSGSQTFGMSRMSRAAEVEPAAAVTATEISAAKAYFNAKDNWNPAPTGGKDVAIEDLADWTNYYVQDVTAGNRLPNDIAQFVGTNDETIDNVAIWNIDPEEVLKLINTDSYNDNAAKVAIDLSEAQLVTGHAIKDISFETTGYTLSLVYMSGVRSSGHTYMYDFAPNYRIAALDGQEDAVYVALYGYTDQNNGFWNRIIKITKVDMPETEEPEVTEPETGDNDIVSSDKILHNNEVEVNLSIMDTHGTYNVEDLTSKLSLHIRSAKDVKVRIPVPVEILVPADDLDIVLAHPDMVKFGENHHAQFEINGQLVELDVQFTDATDCAGNGYGYYIEITTKGINKDVMNYCFDTYGDGVNFEVYNYYQWNTTDQDGNVTRRKPTMEEIETLRDKWLNKTTVEFGYDNGNWNAYINMVDYPYYFINGIGADRLTGGINAMDCLVKVISNQVDAYENSYVGEHLNGSNMNIIYIRNDIFGTNLQDLAHRN